MAIQHKHPFWKKGVEERNERKEVDEKEAKKIVKSNG
jgi:hypothetical protein